MTIYDNTRRLIPVKKGPVSAGPYFKFFTNSRRKQHILPICTGTGGGWGEGRGIGSRVRRSARVVIGEEFLGELKR
jgi:hypothetical protein